MLIFWILGFSILGSNGAIIPDTGATCRLQASKTDSGIENSHLILSSEGPDTDVIGRLIPGEIGLGGRVKRYSDVFPGRLPRQQCQP
jgi:hypothetical protein